MRQPRVAALGTRFYAQRFPVLPAKLPISNIESGASIELVAAAVLDQFPPPAIGRLARIHAWKRTGTGESHGGFLYRVAVESWGELNYCEGSARSNPRRRPTI